MAEVQWILSWKQRQGVFNVTVVKDFHTAITQNIVQLESIRAAKATIFGDKDWNHNGNPNKKTYGIVTDVRLWYILVYIAGVFLPELPSKLVYAGRKRRGVV